MLVTGKVPSSRSYVPASGGTSFPDQFLRPGEKGEQTQRTGKITKPGRHQGYQRKQILRLIHLMEFKILGSEKNIPCSLSGSRFKYSRACRHFCSDTLTAASLSAFTSLSPVVTGSSQTPLGSPQNQTQLPLWGHRARNISWNHPPHLLFIFK